MRFFVIYERWDYVSCGIYIKGGNKRIGEVKDNKKV